VSAKEPPVVELQPRCDASADDPGQSEIELGRDGRAFRGSGLVVMTSHERWCNRGH